MPAPRSTQTTVPSAQVLSSDAYIVDGFAARLKAIPREGLEPQYDECGCGDRRDEHYAKRHERLISACREPGNSSLTSSSSSMRLRIGFPRLVGLAKGKAVGIEVAHVACVGVGPGLD